MRLIFLFSIILCIIGTVWSQTPVKGLNCERLDDRIIIRIDDQTFTVYRFGAGQKYPYFYPVNGPLSGLSVTTESSVPYPHHRSLFFGCDKVNGGNYWQEGNETGQIVSLGASIAMSNPQKIVVQDVCSWNRPGEEPIIKDEREYTIIVPGTDLRIIDARISLTALTAIRIEKTNHAFFAARMVPEMSVKSNGVLVNAAGQISQTGTYGVESPWCDYSGNHYGFIEGLAIFDSPANPWFPCKWSTRDYGFFSPTPMEWLSSDGYRLGKDKTLVLNYRVLVHSGDAKQAQIAKHFEEWEKAANASDAKK